eukprot:3488307-Amphidinium_carterae.1
MMSLPHYNTSRGVFDLVNNHHTQHTSTCRATELLAPREVLVYATSCNCLSAFVLDALCIAWTSAVKPPLEVGARPSKLDVDQCGASRTNHLETRVTGTHEGLACANHP